MSDFRNHLDHQGNIWCKGHLKNFHAIPQTFKRQDLRTIQFLFFWSKSRSDFMKNSDQITSFSKLSWNMGILSILIGSLFHYIFSKLRKENSWTCTMKFLLSVCLSIDLLPRIDGIQNSGRFVFTHMWQTWTRNINF